MRFVKLDVEAFQGIERARVEFGPGLNILYGPNDLGKSTLATAIRAALLLPPKSSEADGFSSWFRDTVPQVALTLVDDAGHTWQVKKAFGDGSSASAELLHAKDGRQFALASRGREVEEKVRALLSWGIPAPGGNRAPRGLPESFLANALLAAQTDVDAILAASLEKDLDESGKVRLQKALATLAQDPTFKRVLERAQRECDTYFTATGRPRRTQGSKRVEADDAVKRHQRELDELTRELEHSRDAEEQVRRLNEARVETMAGVAHGEGTLQELRVGLSNARARREASVRLEDSEQKLAEIESQIAHLRALETERKHLAARVAGLESELAATDAACARADASVREAEETQRMAASEQGEQARQLRAAELRAAIADLGVQRAAVESKREQVQRVEAVLRAADEAAKQVEAARAHQRAASRALESARAQVDTAQRKRELARAVIAYGRFRAATLVAQEAEEYRTRATEHRAEAQGIEAEAQVLEQRVTAAEEALAARRERLPTVEQLRGLKKTRHTLEVAEAALGGGLTIAVRPLRPLSVVATLDEGESVEAEALAEERVFEAERSAHLTVLDLMDLEVTAGAPDKRHAVEQLRARWQEVGAPVLSRAGLSSVSELDDAVRALGAQEQEVAAWCERAARLRGDARTLVGKAELLEQHAARGVHTPDELASLKAAIGETDLAPIEASWSELGKSWELEAQRRLAGAEHGAVAAQERLSKCGHDHELAVYKLGEAERLATERAREAEAERSGLGGKEPGTLLRELVATRDAVIGKTSEAEAALRALEEEAGEARARADRALDAARAQHKAAREAHAVVQTALDAARAGCSTKDGELRVLGAQIERMNQAAAMAAVAEKRAALEALPSSPLATEAEVQAAEAALQRTMRILTEQTEAFHKAEGALTKVGGAQVRERVQQIQEALEAARAREREIEVDAQAWKLLRDTLREAENTEGAHLGRALGGPVGERFVALTGGRYANLRFDQRLRAESLQAAGAVERGDVLDALSVGTRDQLATLVRLTIASQLKSALILDDHLVHTDPARLAWFRQALMKTAVDTQVLVFTCRAEDYLARDELPVGGAVRDVAGGTMRAVDLAQVVQRWEARVREGTDG